MNKIIKTLIFRDFPELHNLSDPTKEQLILNIQIHHQIKSHNNNLIMSHDQSAIFQTLVPLDKEINKLSDPQVVHSLREHYQILCKDQKILETTFWALQSNDWIKERFITVFSDGRISTDQYADVYDEYLLSRG